MLNVVEEEAVFVEVAVFMEVVVIVAVVLHPASTVMSTCRTGEISILILETALGSSRIGRKDLMSDREIGKQPDRIARGKSLIGRKIGRQTGRISKKDARSAQKFVRTDAQIGRRTDKISSMTIITVVAGAVAVGMVAVTTFLPVGDGLPLPLV